MPERDNVKAGLFVAVVLLLALVFIFTLADFGRWFEATRDVKVFYALGDGLKGLKEGATVTLGDVPVGSVATIEDSFGRGEKDAADAPARLLGQMVTARIPAKYQMFDDAVIELNKPPLGSGTELNIRSVGRTNPVDEDHVYNGKLAVSQIAVDFVKEMGIREEQRAHLRGIIANTRDITETLKTDLPRITKNIGDRLEELGPILAKADATLEHLEPTMADLRAVVADVRSRSQTWFDRIDHIATSTDDALSRISELIKDKDSDLRAAVENLKAITQRTRTELLDQVHEALDKADNVVSNLQDASNNLKALMASERPVLERTMANAALMSDQLKLAAIEIRRAPWRLLYTPSDKELETDNLYDAARSFAQAAGALDTATAALKTLAEDQRTDPAQMQRMLTDLNRLFDKFSEAQSRFWTALEDQTPSP